MPPAQLVPSKESEHPDDTCDEHNANGTHSSLLLAAQQLAPQQWPPGAVRF
jgi:hypothetical protein